MKPKLYTNALSRRADIYTAIFVEVMKHYAMRLDIRTAWLIGLLSKKHNHNKKPTPQGKPAGSHMEGIRELLYFFKILR